MIFFFFQSQEIKNSTRIRRFIIHRNRKNNILIAYDVYLELEKIQNSSFLILYKSNAQFKWELYSTMRYILYLITLMKI